MTGSGARSMVVATVVIAAVMIVTVVVSVDIVRVDRHTTVGAAADAEADGRGVMTGGSALGILRNEDQIALGIRRDRMRAGRLRDGLDQEVGFSIDHAEHGLL